jgi:hypothetical protein
VVNGAASLVWATQRKRSTWSEAVIPVFDRLDWWDLRDGMATVESSFYSAPQRMTSREAVLKQAAGSRQRACMQRKAAEPSG